MDFKLTPNFWLSEVVPKREFETLGENAVWLIDLQIVFGAQALRDVLGKSCVINNWKEGGTFEFSGFRPADCKIGAERSQHRFGRALDLKFDGIDSEEVRAFIRKNYHSTRLSKYFSTIEKDTPGWVHIDRRLIWKSEELFEVPFQ